MKKTIKALLMVLVVTLLMVTALASCDIPGTDPCADGHSVEGQPWLSDGTHHWQICLDCEAETEKVAHIPEADDGDCTTEIKCSVCGAETTAGEAAHAYSAWEEGTGDNAGKHIRVCATCGKTDSHAAEAGKDDGNCLTEVLCKHSCGIVVIEAAVSHTEEAIDAVAPTCAAEGSTAGKKCSACGTVTEEPEAIPAIGHKFATPNGDEALECLNGCGTTKVVSVARIHKDVDRYLNAYNWGTTQTQVLDIKAQLPENFGAVTSLKFGDIELCNAYNSIYQDGYVLLDGVQWTLPNEASTYGKQTLVATNAEGTSANVEVLIVTKVIRTVEDYMRYGDTAKNLELGGYFELGNDIIDTDGIIELNSWNNGSYYVTDATKYKGFNGVFDGCGYIIDGLKLKANLTEGNDLVYSFIGLMGKTGVLKNIGFTNVDASEMNLAQSFLATTTYGTFENIYVHYKAGHKNLRTITVMGTSVTPIDITLNNIIIDGSSLTADTVGFKMMPTDKKYDTVYGIAPNGSVVGYYSDWNGTHTGQIFAGYAAFKADATAFAAVKAWGGIWSVNEETGKVIFGAHTNHPDVYVSVDSDNHNKVCVIGGELIGTAEAHTWDNADGVVTKDATCAEAGVLTWTCTACGYKKTAEISKLDTHDFSTLVSEVSATCLAEGKAAHYYCAGCQTYFTAEKVATTEADLVLSTKAHAAAADAQWQTDDDNHWKVCATPDCGEPVGKAAHTWDNGVETTPATEDTPGVKTYTCEGCGKTKTESIPVIGHTHDYAVEHAAVEATCTADGNIEYYTCTSANCSEKFVKNGEEYTAVADIVDPATGHDYEWTIVPASCVDGSKTGACKDCGDTTTEVLPAVGHAFATPDGDELLSCLGGCGTQFVVSNARLTKDLNYDGSWDFGDMKTKILDIRALLPADFGKVTSLTFNGTELSVASSTEAYADGYVYLDTLDWRISNSAAYFGEQTVTVSNGTDTVDIKVLVVTKVIRTVDDYNVWGSTATQLGMGGYFELGNNLSADGGITVNSWNTNSYWQTAENYKGFSGTFDGCGYTIDGLKMVSGATGFVGTMTSTGTIKNVGFTNVDPSAITAATSFFGTTTYGNIDNVFIHYASTIASLRTMTVTAYTGVTANVSVNNLFVDASDATASTDACNIVPDMAGCDAYGIVPSGATVGYYCSWKATNESYYAGKIFAGYSAFKADTTAFAAVSAWADECAYWNIDAETGEVTFGR